MKWVVVTEVDDIEAFGAVYQLIWAILIAILVLTIMVITAAVTTANSISKPMHNLSIVAQKMGEGDFTSTISELKWKDELALMNQAFIIMQDRIRSLVLEVTNTSANLASSSEELSASSDETSKGIQLVANTIQEVAKSSQETAKNVESASLNVESTASAIHKIALDIEKVGQYSTMVEKEAGLGREKAALAVEKITHVKDSVKASSEIVAILGDKSTQIGEIVGVITGIASQTNLLALNAAIEAARAGEAGRGFAVVADEVRKLAEESSQAAENIRKLIIEITNEMSRALSSMNQSNEEVIEGAIVVTEAGGALTTIVEHIDEIARRIEGLGTSSEQISASTLKITDAMTNISAAAQQAASGTESASSTTEEQTAAVEEINASAQQLAKMAEQLQVLVSKFIV